MKKLALALLLVLAPAAVSAQTLFPQSMPANTVVGRVSPVAGPGTAVPIATLQSKILFGEKPVSDKDYPATTSDATIAYTALTAARTVTLVAASSVSPGFRVTILDRSGEATSTLTISAAPTGADLINGANTSTVVVNSAYGGATLESDGLSKWTFVLAGNAALGPAAADTLKCNPTASAAVPQDCTIGAALAFSGSALQTAAMTGDVTTSANSFATTIGANKVTNAKLATMAAHTYKGNNTGSTANASDLTNTQVTADLNVMVGDSGSGGTKGLVPAPAAGDAAAGKFLKADGTFAAPPTSSMTLLVTLTAANSATLSDTTHITNAFPEYEIVFENLVPASAGVTCEIQVHSSGAFQATTYVAQATRFNNNTGLGNAPTTFIPCSANTEVANAAPGLSAKMRLVTPSATGRTALYGAGGYNTATPLYANVEFGGYWNGGATAIDGFQVLFSTGNITSGTVKIYGIN